MTALISLLDRQNRIVLAGRQVAKSLTGGVGP